MTATNGGTTTGAAGSIIGVYGTALASQTAGNATYTISGTNSPTSIDFKVMKLKGDYTATDLANASTIAAKEALLEEKVLPTGLSATKSGLVITISGTPTQIVNPAENWYLVISDKSEDNDDYVAAEDYIQTVNIQITKFTGTTVKAVPKGATATTDRFSGTTSYDSGNVTVENTVIFGAGTEANTSSTAATQGYTVGTEKDSSSTKDNVVPVIVSVSGSIDADLSDYVTAEISALAEGDKNTNTSITTGTESATAFTVNGSSSATSEFKLSTGVNAKFEIAPKVGLTAKAAVGTTYYALLTLKSGVFGTMKYALAFQVTNDLGITKVVGHGGNEITATLKADGSTPAYDLGTLKVGETIDDIVITATGGTGTLSFTADNASAIAAGEIETDAANLQALPSGLTADTSTAGQYKIGGMITTAADSYISNNYHYFALSVKDSGTNVETGKVYFKYKVAQADVEMSMVKGVYNSSKASKLTVGNTTAFAWYGADSTLANDYATLYINNKSKVSLTFTGAITSTDPSLNAFVFNPTSVATAGIIVAAGEEATIKIVPKTLNSSTPQKATGSVTLSAAGVNDTTATLSFEQETALKITKPAADYATDGDEIGTAYVGEPFSYTFEATYPSSVTSVNWSITKVTDNGVDIDANATTAQNYLSTNYGLSFNNGTLSTDALLKAGAEVTHGILAITVTANGVDRLIDLYTSLPAKGLAIESNGKTIKNDGTGTLSLGSVKLDGLSGVGATVNITNATAVKQEGVKARIQTVSGGTDNTNQFEIVYDEDTVRNTSLTNNGYTLAASTGSGSFVIKPTANLVSAGLYTVTVRLSGTSINSIDFTATLTVTDVPTIVTSNLGTYETGTAVVPASNYYSAKYATGGYATSGDNADRQKFTFALVSVKNAAGETIPTIPGLTFNSKGYWEGEPELAGDYEVTVSATTTTLAKDVTGTGTHTLTVDGKSVLTVKTSDAGATTLATNGTSKTYILAGEATGYTANSSKLSLVVSAATANAEGVKVEIADAADDRGQAEDLDGNNIKDVIENTSNPYEGSTTYIGVSTLPTTLSKETGEGKPLTISTKAGAPAGVYKATVTISATNASAVSFDVLLVVTDKLEISVPSEFSAKVGTPVSGLTFTASGGYDDQKITWAEAGTVVSGATKYYVGRATDGASGTQNTTTKLTLATEDKVIGATDDEGIKTSVTGTPDKAGDFTANIFASVPAQVYDNGGANDIIDNANTSNALWYKMYTILRRPGDSNLVGKANAVIPAQTAETKPMDLAIAKSNSVQITDLSYAGGTASGGTITGTVTGKTLNNSYSSISDYSFAPVAVGYTPTALTVTLTDTNDKSYSVKAKLGKGVDSNFTLTGSASEYTVTGIDKTGVSTLTVTPNSGLPIGTYTDTITLSGDNVADFTFNVTFTVAARSYKATIDNDIAPDAADTTDRVAYVTDIESGEGGTPIELGVTTMTSGSTAATRKLIVIRNVGNSTMSNVKVVEVTKTSAGKWVDAATKSLTLTTGDGATNATTGVTGHLGFTAGVANASQSITVGSALDFGVAVASVAAKNGNTAYIDVNYTDASGTKKEIILPVAITVLNSAVDSITVTPGTNDASEVTMTSLAEGYASKAGEEVFTLKNTATARTETLKTVTASLSGTNAAAFDIVTNLAGGEDIEAGKEFKIAVRPVEGLAAGTYVATITLGGANIKQAITRGLKFVVTASDTYEFNKVTTTAYNVSTQSVAERLYNSIVYGIGTTTAAPAVTVSNASGTTGATQKVIIDFDGTQTANGDVEIVFTGTAANSGDAKLTAVSSATIKMLSTNTIETSSKTLSLEDTQITKAKAGLNAKKCFTAVTFDLYGTVTYYVDATNSTETVALFDDSVLEFFGKDDFVFYTGTSADPGVVSTEITTKPDDTKAIEEILVLVPIGNTAGSVFGGSLPTYTATRAIPDGWVNSSTGTKVIAGTKVTSDIDCVINSGALAYPANGSKDGDLGIDWKWTNSNGNITAELTVTPHTGTDTLQSNYAMVITKDTKTGGTTYPQVSAAVTITDKGSTPATCTTGSGTKLTATASIKSDASTTLTYTGDYTLDATDDALGHTWLDPVVTWTDADGDGKYTKDEVTVTRACSVCSEKVELTVVSVTEATSVEPTCTKDGKATYTVTYTDVDKFGKSAGNVTDTKNVKESVVKATGHQYALEIEWASDHKTATKATLVCGKCAETETGHSVDVSTSIEYDLQVDKETGDVISNQAIYAKDTKDEVKSAIWYSHTEHTWGFDGFTWSGLTSATGAFTCSVGNETKAATVDMSSKTNGEGEKAVTAWTATISVDPDGNTIKAITETKYVKADGTEGTKADFNKAAGSSESGSGIGEPEQTGAAAVNLFYTDAELSIPLPTEADVTKGTGAWTSFFKVESDGTVTVIPTATADRKKAASAKNSLIVIPTVDSEGNVIGEFEYSLPVFYQKPALKLTSAKGNVKTGAGDQVLVTKVLEKKSTGEYEPLDVSDQDTEKVALFAAKSGTVAAEAGDNPGEVKLTASAKASGKVVVQLPNWSDKVELNYTVGASAKGVVTASVKSLTFNTGADKDAAQAQTFNVFLNGNEIASEDDGVTVEFPKKDPGLTITGISEGKVTGSEIGFEYGSAAPTKGNYTYKFKSSDGGVATVKIVVSDAALANKAVTYKIPANGKMNIINKTPMVLVPQFKGVSGEITDVTTDNTSFEVEYNEESGQVIVAPADWSKISATNQSVIIKTTVSGVECTTEVKFKPLAKKPTVKIDKLVLPKAKVIASTDDDAAIGFAYINSVVKTGGKSFSVAPDKVEFLDGKNVLAKDDTNWTPVTKSGVTCFYDTEAGFIVVKALPGTNGKLKAVKVQLTYGTTTVTKSLTIKVK